MCPSFLTFYNLELDQNIETKTVFDYFSVFDVSQLGGNIGIHQDFF